MCPAASVSGLYFAHPQSNYFSVGKLNKDQVSCQIRSFSYYWQHQVNNYCQGSNRSENYWQIMSVVSTSAKSENNCRIRFAYSSVNNNY